ncbi:MAG: class I SAM-dependent methyltransferase [Candidatus Absconditabacterales bacterium]
MKKFVDEREVIMQAYTKDKEVLDFGVGDTSDRFLHKIIANSAKNVIGVEIDEERAERLRKQGYTILQGDAEHINIGKQFDVIIAGDLIEHLNNPGLFLENVKKHLKKDGYFLFNTPNAYSINFVLRGLFCGGNVKQFPEHVTVFTDELLVNLLERYGIKTEKIVYFTHKENNIKSYILRLFSKISKRRNENMLFICKL